MATTQHNNPCSGAHETYNFCRPFVGHHDYTLSLYGLCTGVEKKIFYRNTSIVQFAPKLTPFGVLDHEI